jgi:hypothetical protein
MGQGADIKAPFTRFRVSGLGFRISAPLTRLARASPPPPRGGGGGGGAGGGGPKAGVSRRRPLTATLLGMYFWNSVRIDQVIRRAVRVSGLGFRA